MSNDDDNNSMTGTGAEASALDNSPEFTPESEAAPTPVELPTFLELGVQPQIAAALEAVGITRSFAIQALTLPVALGGHDIIGQAKTGTGKTLGFGIPLLQQVIGPGEEGFENLLAPGKPQALVVVPTRELAVQVANDIGTAAKQRAARVLTVYGGRAYEPQIEALKKGIEIVVGTPGRLLDLAQQKHLDLGNARIVVLDEADEMLDLGFLPDVERMLALTPDGRQMMLFSATMPSAVVALARRYMTQPTHIRAHEPDDTGATVKATKQHAYRAHALDKVEMLARMLQSEGRGLTMIFARTKRTVAKVAEELEERGFASAAIHGDLGQGAREQALRAFRNGKVDVLVATDVAARGIDVDAHHPRRQLPVPRGREDLRAPDRPHRPGRQHRHRDHVRRLGRPDALDADRQGARPGHPGAGRDLLLLPAPLLRPRHPRGHLGLPCPAPAPGPGWTPSRSRTWARPASVSATRAAARPAARAVTGIATAGAGHAARAPPIVGTVPTARTGPTAPSAPRATPHGRRAPGSAVAPAPATRSTRRPRRIPQPRLRPPATPPTARVPPLPAVAVAAAAAAPPPTPSNPRNLLMLRG